MQEIGWSTAVAQVALTAGVMVIAMFTCFTPRAGSIALRVVLFVSVGAGLVQVTLALHAAAPVGLVRLGLGTALNGLSHLAFWSAVKAHGRQTPSGAFASVPPVTLALTGPYAVVRHPFYVAYVLAFFAAAVLCESLALALLTVWMTALYGLAAAREERLILESPLGARYLAYREEVGMFLPRLARPPRDREPPAGHQNRAAMAKDASTRGHDEDPRVVFAKAHLPLMSPVEYRRALRPLLPPAAFTPSHAAAYTLLAALVLSYAAYIPLAYLPSRLWVVAFGPLAGMCLASALFAAHDVSHQSSVRHRHLRYLLEVLAFSPFLLSATSWRRFHNLIHHAHTATRDDADRLPSLAERSPSLDRVLRWIVPQRDGHVWNPLMGAHSLLYSALILVWTAAPRCSTNGPNSRIRRRPDTHVRLLLEIGAMLSAQWLVFLLCGSDPWKWVAASGLSIFTASAIANAYIYTNHLLNPLSPSVDPVIGSTSVTVPRVFDWLHSNFSHHTEHHLFPGMASRHYPFVRKALFQAFPERFNCLPLGDVYGLLRRTGPYALPREDAIRAKP